jgi:hypothetical protein
VATDLRAVALSLRLDHLAVRVSRALTAAGVEHALIKGATTVRWLYPEGRRYRDVDVLVRSSQLRMARNALVASGIANARHTRLGEVAQHSLQLTADTGAEIDLHVTLPASPHPVDDELWLALRETLVATELGVGSVPVLDIPGRCLVLAMHVLANGGAEGQALSDLRRAVDVVEDEVWGRARHLAEGLDLLPHLEAAVAIAEYRTPDLSERDVALRLQGASSAELQWERIRRLPWRSRVWAMAREVVPSREFVKLAYPSHCQSALIGLALAYLQRWRVVILEGLRVGGWPT